VKAIIPFFAAWYYTRHTKVRHAPPSHLCIKSDSEFLEPSIRTRTCRHAGEWFRQQISCVWSSRMQKYADSLLGVNSVCRNKRGQPPRAFEAHGSPCIIFSAQPSRVITRLRLCRLFLTDEAGHWENVNSAFAQLRNLLREIFKQ